jgi:hypothetical protein
MVVVGVAVELAVLLMEYRHEWKDFKRGVIHSPEKPSRLVYGLGFFGVALVTAGVAGEFRIHVKAGKIESDMRSDVRQLAAIAHERAASAESTAKGYDSKIAEAQRGTAEAQRDAEQAKERAANAEAETARLYALTAPRRLNSDQQKGIKAALKKFAGRTVRVSTYGLDGEGAALGTQIIAILTPDFKIVDERAQSIVTGSFDFGVHVRGPQSEEEFIRAVADNLRVTGRLQVFTNAALPREGAVMRGNAVARGNAVLRGGGGTPGLGGYTAPGSLVWIEIGVKPVEIAPSK